MMFKFRQAAVRKKVVQVWTAVVITVFYIVLPNLVHAAECAGSAAGSACSG